MRGVCMGNGSAPERGGDGLYGDAALGDDDEAALPRLIDTPGPIEVARSATYALHQYPHWFAGT